MKHFAFFLVFLTTFTFCLNAFEQDGVSSWYGPNFHGKMTAGGEIFNTEDFTAAHRSLPFNSVIKVTSLDNGHSIFVRVTDRGPFAKDRILDLSNAAAKKLDMLKTGTARIHIDLVREGDGKYYNPSNKHFAGKKYTIIIATYKEEKYCDAFMKRLVAWGVTPIKQKGKNKGTYRLILKDLTYEQMQFNRIRVDNAGCHTYKVETH